MKYKEIREYYQKWKKIAQQSDIWFNNVKEIKEYIERIKKKWILFYFWNHWLSPYFKYDPKNLIIKYNNKNKILNISFKKSTNTIKIIF